MGPEGIWNGRGCTDAKGCGGWDVASVARDRVLWVWQGMGCSRGRSKGSGRVVRGKVWYGY